MNEGIDSPLGALDLEQPGQPLGGLVDLTWVVRFGLQPLLKFRREFFPC